MKTKTKKKIINFQNNVFNKIDQDSLDLLDLSRELFKVTQNNNKKSKNNLSMKDYIKKVNYLSNLKIRKKYNCTPSQYEKYVVEYLLNNADCHLVSVFKEKMLTDYIDEFLRRKYNISESKERIPKFSLYYKNYLEFFCKPTYNCFKYNDLIQNYGEKKAELYYKDNYQGGQSNDEEDNGFEESSSDESSNKEPEYELNDNNGEIFNKIVKEKLDNVTVMTTINSTGNNTINLNIYNEKIEVFSENKAEISNDTTINDLMEDIKRETKKLKNRKKEAIKNKYKNSFKNMNYSLKQQDSHKVNKSHKNLSIEHKKKANSKDYSKKNFLNKDKNNFKDKIINNEKILSQKIKSQIFKYNVQSHKINKNNINKIAGNKIQKMLKKKYSKNTYYNNFYNNHNYNFNKESHIFLRNTSSNIKSPDNKINKKNSISGLSGKKVKCRSRNNLGSLYNHITVGINTTTNKNTNINFQTAHINKNSLSSLTQFGNNIYKTLNFMQTAHHQRTNSQLIKKQNLEKNKNKFQSQNIIHDKKTSSLKMLVTDSGNPTYLKQTIKIKKNDKLKTRHSKINIYNINNKNIIINNNENKLNNKITVTTNNYLNNLNNRYSKNTLKKNYVDSNDSINVNSQNYSNYANQMSANQLLYNKEESDSLNKNNYHTKSNGNLMQLALSLLIESNSPSKQINQNTKNIINTNNNINLNNNNNLIKKNIMNQKNKTNFNNINTATHYNININNQININIDNKSYNKNINLKGSKIKNKRNKKKLNININCAQNQKNFSKKKTKNYVNSNNKIMNIPGFNNKIKIKTRNYNVSLKNGFTKNPNYNSRNDKVIKGYHTKSVSNLTDLINHNKKLISLYKSMSKSKSKEKK